MAAPPKGNLAAIKVILSLLLDGPETHASIKKRLRREYPHAGWSRSIVNVSLPALVAQGLIVLIGSGERRGDDLYEITDGWHRRVSAVGARDGALSRPAARAATGLGRKLEARGTAAAHRDRPRSRA